MMKRFSEVRSYPTADGNYVLRDVFDGDEFKSCEYAVKDGDAVIWHSCPEGVMFTDIAPFERVAST